MEANPFFLLLYFSDFQFFPKRLVLLSFPLELALQNCSVFVAAFHVVGLVEVAFGQNIVVAAALRNIACNIAVGRRLDFAPRVHACNNQCHSNCWFAQLLLPVAI